MKFVILKNSQGQSLIQVLITMAIMGILMVVMISMQVSQTRENRAISEKLASMDLQRFVTQALTSPDICSAMVASANLAIPTVFPFNSTTTTFPYVFSLNSLPSPKSGSPPIATAGDQVSALAPSLALLSESSVPAGIQIKITSISPPSASLLLNFDQSKLVRPIRNLEFPINIMTSGPANATTISGCIGSTATPPKGWNIITYLTPGTTTFTVPDNVDYIWVRVIGGGGGGAGNGQGDNCPAALAVVPPDPNLCMRWSGGGGGAGGYTESWVQVTSGQVIPIVVGAGGWGANATGQKGGDSSFGSLSSPPYLLATGGGGAVGGITSCAGGKAGKGSGGQLNFPGASGGDGNPGGQNVQGGQGGSSAFGGGGRTVTVKTVESDGTVACDGTAPGSGGGGIWGGTNPGANGGNGAPGAVVISY
ncbi:MAG: glycine-rich domain-containing protein [Pseudobdellovibrionaceae bacterium]